MSREPLTFREKQLWWELVSATVVLLLFLLLSRMLPTKGGWEKLQILRIWRS